VNSLAIENSGHYGTVAASIDSEIVLKTGFRKAGELSVCIERAIKELPALDEVIVGVGPGSYTGLRIAVSIAFGLELSINCRTLGCSSVLGYEMDSYAVVGDARRRLLFFAIVRNGSIAESPKLVPAQAIGTIRRAVTDLPLFAATPIPGCDDLPLRIPEAEFLLRRRDSFTPLTEPIYLKEPHITASPAPWVPGSEFGVPRSEEAR
jgi:tRNA A37 threonylcarbamoyladenosine modification protein TsaB